MAKGDKMPNTSSGEKSPASKEVRDLFLSHRGADKDAVRSIAARIEAEEFNGQKLRVWLDEAEIRPGQSVPGMINGGLEQSRFFALAMTPDYFDQSSSGWTDAEWHAALHADPDNRKARLIPLLVKDCPYIPMLLRHLLSTDLRDSKFDDGIARLLAVLRNEPLPRPTTYRGQLIRSNGNIDRSSLVAERSVPEGDPDAVQENLSCNLLPVERLPVYLYYGGISETLRSTKLDGTEKLPTKEQIKEVIREAQRQDGVDRPWVPAFRVVGDQIVTFHDLESDESLFSPVVQQDEVHPVPVKDVVGDEDERRLVMSLLSMGLTRYLMSRGLLVDPDPRRSNRYFFPPNGTEKRVQQWKPFKKTATRTVTRPFTLNGRPLFLHQGAYIKPVFLASKFYLQITPTWLFTEDGRKPKGGPEVGKVIIKWTGGERNLQLVYHVRFWTSVLRGGPGPISIPLGEQTIDVATVPAFVQVGYGIKSDIKNVLVALDEVAPLIARQEEEAEIETRDEDEDLGEVAGVSDDDNTEVEDAST